MTLDTHVQPRDVILIHVEGNPAFYARVEEILFDLKPGWRRMRFQVLTLPPQEMVWTLEPAQIDGDPFTMGGTPLRIERLADPVPVDPIPVETLPEGEPGKPRPPGTVIDFQSRRKP